ncbi:MAG TPA: MauE/DoxX family redox-associated membrane protein [Bryobacteraceae bacterium]|nr:MauE/DoxX family redox-associated membrane protein [Bryobacteraceae bacterium]
MAHTRVRASAFEVGGWRTWVSTLSAFLLAVLFITSGVWKITDPFVWAARVSQTKVPAEWSMGVALTVGIAETVAAVLVLVPRFRRWGAMLIALLLIVFMAYFAVNYNSLRGEDCSCFPWLKEAVSPWFFVRDGLMLLGAWLAWRWAQPAQSIRAALIIVGAVAVFAGVSYGVHAARQTGAKAPDSITVDGSRLSLQNGKALIYFFDPQCLHCFEAAKKMAAYRWADVRLIGVPTAVPMPQMPRAFLNNTGFNAGLSNDLAVLKKAFPFEVAPYLVAIENGRQRAATANFDGEEPRATLRKLRFTE